jgi:hypothetical protein
MFEIVVTSSVQTSLEFCAVIVLFIVVSDVSMFTPEPARTKQAMIDGMRNMDLRMAWCDLVSGTSFIDDMINIKIPE